MQPILIFVVSAIGFGLTLWVVHSVLRSIFRTQALNPLGVVLITAGIWLFLFRVVALAIPLLILGAVLLLRKTGGIANKYAPRTSNVRSAYLEMTLDHETGTIDGQILTGQREGEFLSNLALHDLLMFYAEVETDQESVKLFETFLDSRHPDWRDQEDVGSAPGEETSPFSGQLSRDEAHQLLGLEAGCTEEDIRMAYHRIIKRVHPDSGGSAALTAQITAARDRLLDDDQKLD
jgi:hypothetical protein